MDWVIIGKLAYDGALVITLPFVVLWGRHDERIGFAIIVIASAATALCAYLSQLVGIHARYSLLVVDLGALMAFDRLMYFSKRYWPVWVTGIQLAAVALDVVKVWAGTYHLVFWLQGKYAYAMLFSILLSCFTRRR